MNVVKGEELKKLKVWVDIDGDGQTDKGELQELSNMVLLRSSSPGKMESTSTREVEKKVPVEGGVFEEDFYRANYQDVNQAIVAGKFKTGYEHYLKHGMLEGRYYSLRVVNEFNEKNYLLVYADVRELVKMENTVVVPIIIGPRVSMKTPKEPQSKRDSRWFWNHARRCSPNRWTRNGWCSCSSGPKPDWGCTTEWKI